MNIKTGHSPDIKTPRKTLPVIDAGYESFSRSKLGRGVINRATAVMLLLSGFTAMTAEAGSGKGPFRHSRSNNSERVERSSGSSASTATTVQATKDTRSWYRPVLVKQVSTVGGPEGEESINRFTMSKEIRSGWEAVSASPMTIGEFHRARRELNGESKICTTSRWHFRMWGEVVLRDKSLLDALIGISTIARNIGIAKLGFDGINVSSSSRASATANANAHAQGGDTFITTHCPPTTPDVPFMPTPTPEPVPFQP